MCRILEVSESGYYKHKRNEARSYKHAALLAKIFGLLKADPENVNYGVNRIYLYLKNNEGYTGATARYIGYVERIISSSGASGDPKV